MDEGRRNPERDRSRLEPWHCHTSRAADIPTSDCGYRDLRVASPLRYTRARAEQRAADEARRLKLRDL